MNMAGKLSFEKRYNCTVDEYVGELLTEIGVAGSLTTQPADWPPEVRALIEDKVRDGKLVVEYKEPLCTYSYPGAR